MKNLERILFNSGMSFDIEIVDVRGKVYTEYYIQGNDTSAGHVATFIEAYKDGNLEYTAFKFISSDGVFTVSELPNDTPFYVHKHKEVSREYFENAFRKALEERKVLNENF